jgi:hypothetical protein
LLSCSSLLRVDLGYLIRASVPLVLVAGPVLSVPATTLDLGGPTVRLQHRGTGAGRGRLPQPDDRWRRDGVQLVFVVSNSLRLRGFRSTTGTAPTRTPVRREELVAA